MTDPTTPTPPGTAKSAREIIREHTEAFDTYAKAVISDLHRFHEGRRLAASMVALRALADAPEGAGDAMQDTRLGAALRERDEARKTVDVMQAALVKASAECDALKTEREAAQRDLAAARAALSLLCDRARTLCDYAVQNGCRLDIVLGVREAIYGAGGVGGIGAFSSYPPQSVMADLAYVHGTPVPPADHFPDVGKKVDPPPATEAPISERARLVYEGATRMWARTTWGGSDEDVSARVTAFAAAFLAAAERAAKGNAPAEGEK